MCDLRVSASGSEFWGDVFSRFADPFGHLWWVHQHTPAEQGWDAAHSSDDSPTATDEWNADEAGESWETFATPELDDIHASLIDAMASLRDPRGTH